MKSLYLTALAVSVLNLSVTAHAVPVTITGQGYYNSFINEPVPTGPYDFMVSFTIDTDQTVATYTNPTFYPEPASIYRFDDAPYQGSFIDHGTGDTLGAGYSSISIHEDGGFYGNDRDVVRLYSGELTKICIKPEGCSSPLEMVAYDGQEIMMEIGMPIAFSSNSAIPDVLNFDDRLYAGLQIGFFEQGNYAGDITGRVTSITVTPAATSAVPVPASIWLLGSGFLSLLGIARARVER